MQIHTNMTCFFIVVIIDPGIAIDKGYPAYDHGIEQDIFLKVLIMHLLYLIHCCCCFRFVLSFVIWPGQQWE